MAIDRLQLVAFDIYKQRLLQVAVIKIHALSTRPSLEPSPVNCDRSSAVSLGTRKMFLGVQMLSSGTCTFSKCVSIVEFLWFR